MRICVATSKQDRMISHYDVNVITTHMRITSSLLRLKEVYDTQICVPNTKALYSLYIAITTLSLSHTLWCANAYHAQHITHSHRFTQMRTKQKLSSFYFSNSHTINMMWCDIRKCVPHTKHHTYSVSRLCSLSCAFKHKILSYLYAYTHIRLGNLKGGQSKWAGNS